MIFEDLVNQMNSLDGTTIIALTMIFGMISYAVRDYVARVKGLTIGLFTRNFRSHYKQEYFIEFLEWITSHTEYSIFPVKNFKSKIVWEEQSITAQKIIGYNRLFIKSPKLPFFIIDYQQDGSNEKSTHHLEPALVEITTFGRDSSKIDTLLSAFSDWVTEKCQERPDMANDSHGFRRINVRDRSLDSVVLNGNLKQDIINCLESFLCSEVKSTYTRLGVPYRRGLLLYGKPGTGKTSLILALRNHFKIPIYRISLNSVMSDNMLLSLMQEIPKKTFVVLEDIDCIGAPVESRTINKNGSSDFKNDDAPEQSSQGLVAAPQQQDEWSSLTLSGLLNAIDGIGSFEDNIIIMTTNHPESLDEALLRSGRIDMRIELDFLDKNSQVEMFNQIFNSDLNPNNFASCEPMAACDVQEICLRALMDNMDTAKQVSQDRLFQIIPGETHELTRKNN